MAIDTRPTLKSYFETGDYPTQAQFANLIDSLRHMLEKVPMADVDGLSSVLNNFANQISSLLPITGNAAASGMLVNAVEVPVGTLVKAIVLKNIGANGTVSIGTTDGGTDILNALPVSAGQPEAIGVLKVMTAPNIYITTDTTLTYEIHR